MKQIFVILVWTALFQLGAARTTKAQAAEASASEWSVLGDVFTPRDAKDFFKEVKDLRLVQEAGVLTDSSPVIVPDCFDYNCDHGWIPKFDHHDLKGQSNKDCCLKTCALFTCPAPYWVANAKYKRNWDVSESKCCDKTCSAVRCDGSRKVPDEMKNVAGLTPDDCCVDTCNTVKCPGFSVLIEDRKLKEYPAGEAHEFCCVQTCAAYTCDLKAGLASDPSKSDNIGSSDAECCTATCSQTNCPPGYSVPPDMMDQRGSGTDECCRTQCPRYTCSKGWAPDPAKAHLLGDDDWTCCQKTCELYTCSPGWVFNTATRRFVQVSDETCCLKTCSQFQDQCTGDYAPSITKKNVIGDSLEVCCSRRCSLFECANGEVLIPNPKSVVGATDAICCEHSGCAALRNKTVLPFGNGCNGLHSGLGEMSPGGAVCENSTAPLMNSRTGKLELLACEWDAKYELCHVGKPDLDPGLCGQPGIDLPQAALICTKKPGLVAYYNAGIVNVNDGAWLDLTARFPATMRGNYTASGKTLQFHKGYAETGMTKSNFKLDGRTNSWTVAAWVKYKGLASQSNGIIVGGLTGTEFSIGMSGGCLGVKDPQREHNGCKTELFDGNYHSVIVAKAAGKVTFYVDGLLVFSKGGLTGATDEPEINIGVDRVSGGKYWAGETNEVIFLERAVSAREASLIHHGMFAGTAYCQTSKHTLFQASFASIKKIVEAAKAARQTAEAYLTSPILDGTVPDTNSPAPAPAPAPSGGSAPTTSTTTLYQWATASSHYAQIEGQAGPAVAANAFDDEPSTWWDGCCTGYPDQWLALELKVVKTVYVYAFVTKNEGRPVAWTLEGSHDGNNYSTLDERTQQQLQEGVKKLYAVQWPGSYKYLRWHFTQGDSLNVLGYRIEDVFLSYQSAAAEAASTQQAAEEAAAGPTQAAQAQAAQVASSYQLIGSGICHDSISLPEGAYPAFLDSSSTLHSPDPLKECANRCIYAAVDNAEYGTAAFHVNPEKKCSCARGECSTQNTSGIYATGWASYRVVEDATTLQPHVQEAADTSCKWQTGQILEDRSFLFYGDSQETNGAADSIGACSSRCSATPGCQYFAYNPILNGGYCIGCDATDIRVYAPGFTYYKLKATNSKWIEAAPRGTCMRTEGGALPAVGDYNPTSANSLDACGENCLRNYQCAQSSGPRFLWYGTSGPNAMRCDIYTVNMKTEGKNGCEAGTLYTYRDNSATTT